MRSTEACTSNVVGVRGLLGVGELLCFTSSQLQADRSSSPLVSLLNKRIYKFKSRDLKSRNLLFSNFKIPFTRKSWLLKFDFACNLTQILEPKQIRSASFYFAFYKITKTLAKWEAKCLIVSSLQSWYISQHSYLCFLYSPFLHFGI